MQVYFIGCLHLGHKWMAQHRGFQDEFYHDEHLIDMWNRTVPKKRSIVYVLGDITMETDKHYYQLDRLNGIKRVVLGNHDLPKHTIELLKYVETVSGMIDYKGFVLTHCPIHPAEISFCRGNIHCVDEKTEILTKNGWKKYNQIKVGDPLYTLNKNGYLEEDFIKTIVFNEYTGNIITYKNRGSELVYSDEHRVLFKNIKQGQLKEFQAKALLSRNKHISLPCSAIKIDQKGINISDEMLKLYICLAADGNITKYKSCRLNVHKKRKHDYFINILNKLNIKYSSGKNKSFNYTLSFHLPEELINLNIKGLDELLLNCNRHQCQLIIQAYQNTDGYKNGNSVHIYTSKYSEIEILSALFTINGFRTNLSSRRGGFKNSGVSYCLAVSDKQFVIKTNPKKFTKSEKVQNKLMWCVQTKNENFITRRNGETIITGNCHIHENKLLEVPYLSRYGDPGEVVENTLHKYHNVDAWKIGFKPRTLEEIINNTYY
jgi:calcineurin-like phosphoesterase family protein